MRGSDERGAIRGLGSAGRQAGGRASRKECGRAGRGRAWMRSRSWRAGLLCGLQVEVSGDMARIQGRNARRWTEKLRAARG